MTFPFRIEPDAEDLDSESLFLQPAGRFRRGVRLASRSVRLSVFVLCCFGLTLPAAASPGGPADVQSGLDGSLASYLQRALEANPELQAFRGRYEASTARIPQARSLPDPMLQVTHFVEAMRTEMGTQDTEIMLSQQIPWFGKRGTREAVASAEAEVVWHAFRSRQLALVQEVAAGFYEYSYIGKAIQLETANLRLLEELDAVVQERVRTGDDLNSLLRLRVETGRARDRLFSLEEQRRSESARLARMLALAPETVLPLPALEAPPGRDLDEASLIRSLEEGNPELAMLERQAASAEAARRLARLEGRPDFVVGVNYMLMGGSPNAAMTRNRDPWGISVGVSLPLWQEKYRARVRETNSLQLAAEREREDRLNALRAEVVSRSSEYRDARRRLALYGDDLLGLARQSLDNTRTSYESGRATIIEFIDSERTLIELELLYWRAASDAARQLVALQALTNQPIGGFVRADSSP